MKIIDGKKIRDEILAKVKKEIANLSFKPVFCDVLVGEDPVSAQYVRMKARMSESVGIKFQSASFPSDITTEDLVKEIKILNKVENMCGIIIQLPLPASLDQRRILDSIDSKLDVDCLGSVASEKFYNGDFTIIFPTALACMQMLDSLNLDLKDKKIIIIGKGELVGRPVKKLLNARNLETFVIDRKTEENERIKRFKEADVIISATGKGKLINGNMIKKGAILIDAGTSESGAGIVGDIDLDSVSEVAGYVSPVPGGVGPVTVAMLLNNVLIVAKSLVKSNE
ncbi:MAG: bifunctional 5,10-methylenetetrahydrofolate dehydrogenase/5,10-methenyltetrahydrofolate cyclohydrolase [Candidatus Paceibacterota bacterium]